MESSVASQQRHQGNRQSNNQSNNQLNSNNQDNNQTNSQTNNQTNSQTNNRVNSQAGHQMHSEDERIRPKLLGSIVAVGSLAFVGILTETVMTVLFPELMVEFNVDTATVQWITTIYLLAVAATMPLSSFVKRRFTNKSIFLAAVTLAVIGSLLMIVGHVFPLILIARVIQGIGSGLATPLMMNIILEQSPRSKIGRLMGVGSLVITVAPAIGPTVGGAVSSVLPWRAIFVIVIPVVLLISLPVGLACIEQKRPTEEAYLNPLQFVSIVLALSGLILFVNQAGVAVGEVFNSSNATTSIVIAIVSLVVGVGSLLFFAWSSRHAFSPLIRLGWLRNRVVLFHLLPYAILPMVGIGYGYVITNLAQISLGTDAFTAGALVLPGALIGAVCAPLGGMLFDKLGPTRPILGAMIIATLGPLLMLIFSMHLTTTLLVVFYFVFNFCYALEFSNIMTSALREVPAQFTPDGNAVFQTAMQFGGAAGTALFSTVLSVAQVGYSEGTASYVHATTVGGSWVFAIMVAICVLSVISLICAFVIRSQSQRDHS